MDKAMSEFYGTFEGFNEYHAARGNMVSDILESKVNMALLRMSEWLDATYRNVYPGHKFGQREQVREWPRYDAYDVNDDLIDPKTVPIEIEQATYVVALKWLNDPSIIDVDYTAPKYTKASVSGAVSVTYAFHDSPSDIQVQFATVNKILSVFMKPEGSNSLSGGVHR